MDSHHKCTGYCLSAGNVAWRNEEQGRFQAALMVLWSRFEKAAPVLSNIRKNRQTFPEPCIGDGMTVSQYSTITRSVGRAVALAVLFLSLLTCTASGYDIAASMLPMEINETVVSLYGNEFTLTGDWTGSATDHFAVLIVAPDVIFDGGGHLLSVTLADDSIEE